MLRRWSKSGEIEDAISLRTGKLGVINPAFGVDANAFTKDHIQPVEFDVAITVSDKASGGGKAGLKIFSVELGANGAKEKENSTVSRIKFTIPDYTLRPSGDARNGQTPSFTIMKSARLIKSASLPALVTAAGDRAGVRFVEFFTANIRNPHTRRAYARAVNDFLAWCADAGMNSIVDIQTGPCCNAGLRRKRASLLRQRQNNSSQALRHLFDWLVVGQIVPVNPAASVRGPSHIRQIGQNASSRRNRGARAARRYRHYDAGRPARSRVDRADGLFVLRA